MTGGTVVSTMPRPFLGQQEAQDTCGRGDSACDFFSRGVTDIADGSFHIVAGRLEAGLGERYSEVYVAGNADSDEDASLMFGSAGRFPIISEDTDTGPFTVGAERTTGGELYDGAIARILLYDRELSDAEFNQNRRGAGDYLRSFLGREDRSTLALR